MKDLMEIAKGWMHGFNRVRFMVSLMGVIISLIVCSMSLVSVSKFLVSERDIVALAWDATIALWAIGLPLIPALPFWAYCDKYSDRGLREIFRVLQVGKM